MAIDKTGLLGQSGYMARRAKATETRLSELRIARGFESAALARMVPMQLPTLRKYEKGERRISPTYATRIAAALRVEVKELFAPYGSMIPDPLPGPGHQAELSLDPIEELERLKLLGVWGRLDRDIRNAALVLIEAAVDQSRKVS